MITYIHSAQWGDGDSLVIRDQYKIITTGIDSLTDGNGFYIVRVLFKKHAEALKFLRALDYGEQL